jgi:hypothetical protein
MKKITSILLLCMLSASQWAISQCPSGFTQAQLNWDNLEIYYYTGTSGDYGDIGGPYVTTAQEQTQRFAIGTTWLTFATSASGLIKGETPEHTGNVAGYTGEDVEIVPTANGQTITITFAAEVQNVSFTLYDVDRLARFDFGATNAANAARPINLTTYGTSLLTTTNNGLINPYVTAANTSSAVSSNVGTVTVSIPGAVKQVVITMTAIGGGTDLEFWFSDINACVTGSFPTNYHQMLSTKPFVGQPAYVLSSASPSAYMIDPATGRAWHVFTDPVATSKLNSLAYDAEHRVLYYMAQTPAENSTELKKYDFNTETISVVSANFPAFLGIPSFSYGIERAAAAFYNGALYLGIEDNDNDRESMIWKVELSAGGIPTDVYQVWSMRSGSADVHDWADFLMKDGMLIDVNSASGFTSSNASVHHYNLMTGEMTTYKNPASGTAYSGQAALDWYGNVYIVRADIQRYNMNGTLGASFPITSVSGPAWSGAADDASEPFKPKMDFGDAPLSYDPVSGDPAVHEMDTALRMGVSIDREWDKRGVSGTDDVDNGVATVPILCRCSGTYTVTVSVYNNKGSAATLVGWLDYNGNGIFEASEGISATVSSSTATQNITLHWPSAPTTIANGGSTYLRLRLTSAVNNLTTARSTGYVPNGEVEDYRVLVYEYPLETEILSFTATSSSRGSVSIKWTASEVEHLINYRIQKSTDGSTWQTLSDQRPLLAANTQTYTVTDNKPVSGNNYYRLLLQYSDGSHKISKVEQVSVEEQETLLLYPNPAKEVVNVQLDQIAAGTYRYQVISSTGQVVLQKEITVRGGLQRFTIATGGLRKGQYQFCLKKANGETVAVRGFVRS